jgi:hypothetical protein
MKAELPAGLIEHAKQRTRAVVKKLRDAQKIIEAEIETAEGIYPYNGGKLSQAELCRRAKISQVTLATPAHRDTTKRMVDEWLIRVRTASITGSTSVRRAVTDRAEDWKRQHKAIADNYRLAELEMLDMRRELKKLRAENDALRELLEKSGSEKVVALHKWKKDSPPIN